MRISKIIVALLVSVVALTAMTGVAVAEEDPIRINGTIYQADGVTPLVGATVQIDRLCNQTGALSGDAWWVVNTMTTNNTGWYSTGWVPFSAIGCDCANYPLSNCCQQNGTYRLLVGGSVVDTKVLDDEWTNPTGYPTCCYWEYKPWNADIPEFATIAIPAVAVLGLFLIFNKRKHKKD